MYLGMRTLAQDKAVWEHKSNIAPRNIVAGDGPFGAFGKWLEQFYCDKSVGYGDDSKLDW